MSFLAIVQQLAAGMGASFLVFALTLIFSLPLGLVVTFGRMNNWAPLRRLEKLGQGRVRGWLAACKPIQLISKLYISVMRGTPLMLQLLVVCYGPYYVFGLRMSQSWRIYAIIIGFSINYAAYFAEIYRSGIQAVPQGQREAAKVLGYTRVQTFCKIVFPQMCRHVVPPVTNEIITLVKDTSLAFVLAYQDMFSIAKQIAAAQTTIMPLFVAGLFYYIFNLVVAAVMEKVETKMNYYH